MAIPAPVRATERQPTRWRLTVDDYVWLHEAGRMPDDVRTELLDGEIFVMAPTGPLHISATMVLHQRLVVAAHDRALVLCQADLTLDERTLVLPDIALLRPEPSTYATRKPVASDALLVVEVAQSSLAYDRRRKLPLYARAGVPEVWIAAIDEQVLEVHRAPTGGRYEVRAERRPGDTVAPEALPDIVLDVEELLRSRYRGG